MKKKHNDDCIKNDCNYCKYDENILKQRARFIRTQSEARQLAIDWQNWASEQNKPGKEPTLYMSDLVEWAGIFTRIAKKFHLVREFKENAII